MAEAGARIAERPFNPGSCDICHQELRISEIGFRSYRCYQHCVCEYCDEYPDEITNLRRMECPICEPAPARPRTSVEERNVGRSSTSLQNIVIVADHWGNNMKISYTLARDLVTDLAKYRAANLFIIVNQSNDLQRQILRIAYSATIFDCPTSGDDDIDKIRREIGPVGTLIGFVPSTWDKTVRFKEICAPDRTVLLLHNSTAVHVIRHLEGQDIALFSLGPFIYNALEQDIRRPQIRNSLLVPPVCDEYFVNIKDVPNNDFRIIFPMVIEPDHTDTLSCQVLSAIGRFQKDTGKIITITVMLNKECVNNTMSIRDFVELYSGIRPKISFYTNELNWIDNIQTCDLAICISHDEQFSHWMYRLMNKEIPFLVAAESGMGLLLRDAYFDSAVQNDEDEWYEAIRSIQEDRDGAMMNYCTHKQAFARIYKKGFHPLRAFIFGEQIITLSVNEEARNQIIFDECNQMLTRTYNRLESVFSRINIRDICRHIVRQKLSNMQCRPRDLETEKQLIQLHRSFQMCGHTITYVEAGSLVIHTIPMSEEAITKLKHMERDGDLLELCLRLLGLNGRDKLKYAAFMCIRVETVKAKGMTQTIYVQIRFTGNCIWFDENNSAVLIGGHGLDEFSRKDYPAIVVWKNGVTPTAYRLPEHSSGQGVLTGLSIGHSRHAIITDRVCIVHIHEGMLSLDQTFFTSDTMDAFNSREIKMIPWSLMNIDDNSFGVLWRKRDLRASNEYSEGDFESQSVIVQYNKDKNIRETERAHIKNFHLSFSHSTAAYSRKSDTYLLMNSSNIIGEFSRQGIFIRLLVEIGKAIARFYRWMSGYKSYIGEVLKLVRQGDTNLFITTNGNVYADDWASDFFKLLYSLDPYLIDACYSNRYIDRYKFTKVCCLVTTDTIRFHEVENHSILHSADRIRLRGLKRQKKISETNIPL